MVVFDDWMVRRQDRSRWRAASFLPECPAMNPVWHNLLRERLASLPRSLMWGSLGLLPYLLFFTRYGWSGLLISLGYGFTVAFCVWFTFSVVYAAVTWLQRRQPELEPGWKFQVLTSLAGTLAGVYLANQFLAFWSHQPLWGRALYHSFLIGLGFVTCFSLYALYQDARATALQQQAALAEARYRALENQLQPHFLFNALNNLGELIETQHSNAAAVAFTLAELYQQILANSKTKTATVAAELAIARAYLELEKLRFGDRLHYVIEPFAQAERVYLPSLILQTLVENAVKHGLARVVGGGSIEIAIRAAAHGGYQLQVSNTSEPGRDMHVPAKEQGTGLANTRKRLSLLYGERHRFSLGLAADGRTVASFYFTGERLD